MITKYLSIKRLVLLFFALLQIQLVNIISVKESTSELFFFIAFGLVVLIGSLWIISAYSSNISFSTLGKNWLQPITLYLVFGFIAGITLGQYQDHQRKANAEQIIVAVDNYKKTNGNYPLKLEDLEPTFLGSIPSSHWGMMRLPFFYASDKNGFSLSYQEVGHTGKTYTSGTRDWQFFD
jgi:hypothetical protein